MWFLRWLERGSRAVLRLAPVGFREAWQHDLVATLRESCLAARRRRGWPGLVWASMLELIDLVAASVRARFGGAALSSRPPRHPRRSRPGAVLMQTLVHDLRLAVRSLVAARMATVVAVATLALGIGVNVTVFSVLDAVVIRPLPFANADRLAELWNFNTASKFAYPGFPRPLLLEWRKQSDLFDRVEAYDVQSLIYDGPNGAEMVSGTIVTPTLISMLGVAPLAGRTFADGDGRGGTSHLALLSETFWSEAFGRDPAMVGKSIVLNGEPHTVVGIMPASFHFPGQTIRIWVPYDITAPPPVGAVNPRVLTAFVRRAATIDQAALDAEVVRRGPGISEATGGASTVVTRVNDVGTFIDARTRQSMLVLAGAVAFLLLIVCANLANLSLARTLARSRDFAVRAAMGASRLDLVRETIIENLLVGAAGAGLGLAVAFGTLRLTISVLPSAMMTTSMNTVDLDGRAVAFTCLVGLGAALVFGLAPALMASRTTVTEVLKRDSRSSAGSVASRRLRGGLVVAEVTLAIVLLVGAALMARSFVKLQRVDRGFDSRGLVALRVGLPATGYADPLSRDAFSEALIARALQLPGITAATAGYVPPDASIISFGKLQFAGRPDLTKDLILPVYQVWPNYFEAVGIPVRAGRAFRPREPADSVIVSESFARDFWPDGSAVGAQFRFEDAKTWRTIVGVAGEVRQLDLDDSTGSYEFYYPLQQPSGQPAPASTQRGEAIASYQSFIVRAADPSATVNRLREAVHDVDPHVVIWRVDRVDALFADAIARPRIVMLLMSIFAGVGLVLAAAGIYGVLSYLVAQRRREIGIRLALGARPEAIGRLILGNGLGLTSIGVALGVSAALALVRVMRALLYDVEPSDPASILIVCTVLFIVAVLAAWRPARRAMQVDPVALLREE
jgi:putative ABC transport system permease protein